MSKQPKYVMAFDGARHVIIEVIWFAPGRWREIKTVAKFFGWGDAIHALNAMNKANAA